MISTPIEIKLIPQPTESIKHESKFYYEQIMMVHNGYPFALFHIDLLWTKEENSNLRKIYAKLNSGKTVECNLYLEDKEN